MRICASAVLLGMAFLAAGAMAQPQGDGSPLAARMILDHLAPGGDHQTRLWTNIDSTALRASQAQRAAAPLGPGDVSGNGTISLVDAAMIERHMLALSTLTGDPLDRADANQDGKVDVADLVWVINNPSPAVLTADAIFIDDQGSTSGGAQLATAAAGLSVTSLDLPTITLSWTGGGSPPLSVDDIIFGNAFGGFLRKITSIDVAGTIVTLQTTEASLTDALVGGQFVGSVVFDGAGLHKDLSGTTLYPNPLIADPIPGLTVDIPNGSVDFDPVVDVDFAIEDSDLRYLRFGVDGDVVIDIDVHADADLAGTWGGSYTIPGLEIQQPFAVGYVAGLLRARLQAKVDVTGTVAAEAQTGFNATIPIAFGSEYLDGDWHHIPGGRETDVPPIDESRRCVRIFAF